MTTTGTGDFGVLGDYELVTYMHVRRVDGTNNFYEVRDGMNIEITRDEFLEREGVEG